MINQLRNVVGRRHLIMLSIAFLLGVTLTFVGFNLVSASPEDDVVAVVNGHVITKDAFITRLQEDAGEAILSQMITEMLVLQSQESRGATVTDEEISAELEQIMMGFPSEEIFQNALQMEGLTLERLTEEIKFHIIMTKLSQSGIAVTDDEIVAFFEENVEFFGEPESLLVRHILVETKEEADAIIKELNSGANFATLATEKSIDTGSAVEGGLIGLIDENSPLVEPFIDAAFLLDEGQVSPPVESSFGWHIIRVDEKFPEVEADLANYRDAIEQHLLAERGHPMEQIIDELADEADIDIRWTKYQSLIP